jgi:hypothetical protein
MKKIGANRQAETQNTLHRHFDSPSPFNEPPRSLTLRAETGLFRWPGNPAFRSRSPHHSARETP